MAIITGGTVLAAVPASAAPYCASGYHCVFFTYLTGPKHSYFNSDPNFTNDYFTNGAVVNDNVWAASNSSNSGYESHYYRNINYKHLPVLREPRELRQCTAQCLEGPGQFPAASGDDLHPLLLTG
ncbi:hypothetical protein [Actinopolymorpha rutila]|uniref:Peptidase inhibitor family I36 n=1 Tax=Actinopolymorpha rutila TaxID=446787 RepID=A0A852ZLR4_9ACTN|nr:hypothetical protein [Actinopolymorpha rutila]NYH89366.1 hypothetical protein [Actinopolymorpha rutila]